MVFTPWHWLRQQVKQLALSRPRLMTGLLFFFLYTVSNYVHFATTTVLKISPFWQMLVTGAVLATFASLLLYEVVRLHRHLAEVQTVTMAARTIRFEINNAFTVIQLSTEKLRDLQGYDENSVRNILAQGAQVRDGLNKLAELEKRVHLHEEPGFEGLIDIAQSQ